MRISSFFFRTLAFIFFLSFASAVHSQTAPVFVPGSSVSQPAKSTRVLAADLNHDGSADLVSLESGPTSSNIVIYLSNGDGTFRAPFSVLTGVRFADFAVGDFDQDGNLDLVVVNNTLPLDSTGQATVAVIFGNGQGAFSGPQNYSVGGAGSGIAAGDFNNDGRTDLAVLHTFSKSITIMSNTGGAFTLNSFTAPTHFDTANPGFKPDLLTSIAAGDFNGDGKMDLVYQDSCGDPGCATKQEVYYLLTNNGNGFAPTLIPVSSTGAFSLHTADLDGDGRSDFYFAFSGCQTPCVGVAVVYPNADGSFQSIDVFDDNRPNGGSPLDVIAGDFNNDGIMDIAAASSFRFASGGFVNPGLDIYTGKGGRLGFANPVHFDSTTQDNPSPSRIAAGFINHDGEKDILLAEDGDFIPYMNDTGTAQDPCAFLADPGINFCLPGSGTTVNSPVRFRGTFHAPTQPADRIELWIDGQKRFQVFDDLMDILVPVSAGAHTATLVGVSATGQFIKSTRGFTVQAGCPVPASATVSICAPPAGAVADSPVHIAASAAAPAGRTITAMRIYIDNVAQVTVADNNIAADLTLSAGSHLLAVVAWDNTGVSEKSTETFTVSGGTAGPCLPSAPGAKICTPTAGATVTSPVEVSAGAVPTAQKITAIRVYLDNVAIFFSSNTGTANSFSIDQKLTMAAGTHNLVVVAYQNDGTALTAGETITVH